MHLLDQSYTAISVTGKEFHIFDVESLIKDFGYERFFSKFGLFHDIVLVHRNEYNQLNLDLLYEVGKGKLRHSQLSYDSNIFYQFKYVLVDGLGKTVDPLSLLIEFYLRYPGELNRKPFRKKRKILLEGKAYGSRHQIIKQALGVVKEDGEPEIRKRTWILDYSHFDDPYFKSKSKESWKKYRKTQYRT